MMHADFERVESMRRCADDDNAKADGRRMARGIFAEMLSASARLMPTSANNRYAIFMKYSRLDDIFRPPLVLLASAHKFQHFGAEMWRYRNFSMRAPLLVTDVADDDATDSFC